MDADALFAVLQETLPDVPLARVPGVDAQTSVYVSPALLPKALRAWRDSDQLQLTFLAELTAVDFWPRKPRFELVYVLVSIPRQLRLRVKVRLDGDPALASTVSDIWPAANWLEREVWDLFGIQFEGHPDPRRLLMPEDWEGFPLRKDYPVQINRKVRTSEPMQMTEEEFRANMQKDRLTRGS
jgi:NADH-quinone oxidoreductase subunit C